MKRPARIMLAAPSADIVARPEVMRWAGPKGRGTKPAEAGQATGNPMAGEAEMAEAERELARAMQEYKRRSGRMFPTWSEVLEVVQGLGYRKPA
jgi:hypothetical protein